MNSIRNIFIQATRYCGAFEYALAHNVFCETNITFRSEKICLLLEFNWIKLLLIR